MYLNKDSGAATLEQQVNGGLPDLWFSVNLLGSL